MAERPDLAAALRALAARVGDLDPAQVAGELEALKWAIWMTTMAPVPGTPNGGEDRLLPIEEAAAHLGVTRDWLRRRPDLPFVVKLSEGVVRYSSRGIGQYIASRIREGSC